MFEGDPLTARRVVAVIQARMGSSRFPGKVVADISGRPLVEWTIGATRAIPGVTDVIVATTREPGDDSLARLVEGMAAVYRGPTFDVLTRVWDAARAFHPDVVVRQTADNPFPDPDVVASQVDALVHGGLDFVGNTGWPLGIAAEVASASALAIAVSEAADRAEREHVMPFLYARPDRFKLGSVSPSLNLTFARLTVDTAEDLELARAVASRVGHGPPIRLHEIEAVFEAEPQLRSINPKFSRNHGGRPMIGLRSGRSSRSSRCTRIMPRSHQIQTSETTAASW